MPFTPAHAAAALPLRRSSLIPSALVVGCLAPDFEYFLRLAPDDRFGHSLRGVFVFTLPVALLVLWGFHELIKVPAAMLLPECLQRRLQPHMGKFRFSGTARFFLIVGSVLAGIATHVLWDSFTHNSWLAERWELLREPAFLPVLGRIPYYKLFQYASTVIGLVVLALWLWRWYRTSLPSANVPGGSPSPARKLLFAALLVSNSVVLAYARAFADEGLPGDRSTLKRFLGKFVVTAIALIWWELAAMGLLYRRRKLEKIQV